MIIAQLVQNNVLRKINRTAVQLRSFNKKIANEYCTTGAKKHTSQNKLCSAKTAEVVIIKTIKNDNCRTRTKKHAFLNKSRRGATAQLVIIKFLQMNIAQLAQKNASQNNSHSSETIELVIINTITNDNCVTYAK